jgi:hypothetical protein
MTGELLPWLTGAGGCIVALFLWVLDLRQQRQQLVEERNYERARNTELTDRYTASITAGNEAIRDLTDAVLDATDLVTDRPPTRRRRSSAR